MLTIPVLIPLRNIFHFGLFGFDRVEDCLLITSAFHMRRSLACYRKAGLDIETFSTDFYGLQDKIFLTSILLPSIEGFIIWEKLFKEWTGFVAYKIAGYI